MGGYYQWGRNDDVTNGILVMNPYDGMLIDNSTNNTNFYLGNNIYGDWYIPEAGRIFPV